MSSEALITVENVRKKFCRSLKQSLWYGMKDIGREMLSQTGHTDELRSGEFWAVNDASFELRRGECLGLIGRNGAGKTTLLKMLNGLIKPDQGRITMRGRVGALIALGAGFNPILTGRENIYVNASVLGLTKREIDAKIEEIIDFSEIREFIDAPVQSYSSGMQVRLGFAVATVLDPDVLLLDEVLAVGDMGFTIKCLNTVRKMMSRTAVVFVSHSMQFVSQFCTRIVVMEKGAVSCDTSSVGDGIDRYLSHFPIERAVAGTGEAVIENVQLKTGNRLWQIDEEAIVSQGDELGVFFNVRMLEPRSTRYTVAIVDQGQNPIVFLVPSESGDLNRTISPPDSVRVCFEVGKVDLNAGKYSLVISAEDKESQLRLARLQGVGRFRVVSHFVHWAHIVRSANVVYTPA